MGGNGGRRERCGESIAELVEAAVQGDQGAWDEIVARFNGLVWAVIRRQGLSGFDAADVSQTTWLRLAEHLGSLRNPYGIGSWLAMTARRESLRTLRRSRRQVPHDDEELFDRGMPAAPDVDGALLREEQHVELREAVAGLSPRCERLLRMLMEDPAPTYAEISAALDMPIGSIGPTRARCLACLRRLHESQTQEKTA